MLCKEPVLFVATAEGRKYALQAGLIKRAAILADDLTVSKKMFVISSFVIFLILSNNLI